jgi:hypothetical protein
MAKCQKFTCNKKRQKGDSIPYHNFPKSGDVLADWIAFCDQPDRKYSQTTPRPDGSLTVTIVDAPWQPACGALLCGRHFKQEDYLESRLKPGARPSIQGEETRSSWRKDNSTNTQYSHFRFKSDTAEVRTWFELIMTVIMIMLKLMNWVIHK